MTVWRNRNGLGCYGGRGTERRGADSKGDTLQNFLSIKDYNSKGDNLHKVIYFVMEYTLQDIRWVAF